VSYQQHKQLICVCDIDEYFKLLCVCIRVLTCACCRRVCAYVCLHAYEMWDVPTVCPPVGAVLAGDWPPLAAAWIGGSEPSIFFLTLQGAE
jgi:hypothetical protein